LLHATGTRFVPPIFAETIYRWQPDGLFGVGLVPSDAEGECGPLLGLCVAADPPTNNLGEARRIKLKFWWTSGVLKRDQSNHLAVEMFEAFFARLPEWAASVYCHVRENDQTAINNCVAARMKAGKVIRHKEEPDEIVFSRSVVRDMNR
jgi:hypothetical protein